MGMSSDLTLFESLKKHLSSHKARIKVLSFLIIGVIRIRDVNLVKLTSYQDSAATDESQYRKLQRFFKEWEYDWKEVAQLTLSKIPKPPEGYTLNMDRTNWKFGRTHINILTVGIVVGKVSIPLVWMTLPQTTKRGNSNARHRIALMNKVLKVIPAKDIYALTLDREFNGYSWLKWLNDKNISYVLRLRKNTKVNGKDAKSYRSSRKAKCYEKKEVFGLQLYFASKYITKGRASHLYAVSNTFTPLEALEVYKTRWSIEVLFGHLKKKGFNLENTHISQKKKMDKMVAVLALATLFTIGWGLIVREKYTLTAHQKRKSVFRLGLDLLNSMLVKPSKYKEKVAQFEDWVSSKLEPLVFVV